MTKDGPDPNKPCVFPFNYGGTSYSKCSTQDNPEPWCATEVDANGNYEPGIYGKWGNCDSNCDNPSSNCGTGTLAANMFGLTDHFTK